MDKRKPILFIDNSEGFGGSLLSLYRETKALDMTKYGLNIVVDRNIYDLPAFDGWAVFRLRFPRYWKIGDRVKAVIGCESIGQQLLARIINRILYSLYFLFKELPYVVRICSVILRKQVAIVQLNNGLSNPTLIFALRILRRSIIVHHRGFTGGYTESSPLVKVAAKMPLYHIAASRSVRQDVRSLTRSDEKIELVHGCVDSHEFRPDIPSYLKSQLGYAKDEQVLGIFGRVVEWKGHESFVRMLKNVVHYHPSVRAIIVGDGAEDGNCYLNRVKDLVKTLGLQNRVKFCGYQKDVRQWMSICNVIVHASTAPEPFGLVIIEGMAMGKPVVATRGGGPDEIIANGINGILVPPDDVNSMTAAVLRLLEDKQYATRMGQEARQTVVEKFSCEAAARKLNDIYLTVLQCPRRALIGTNSQPETHI